MCGSMVDIQSPTAEIRRGNKKEEESTAWKYIWWALLHRAAINIVMVERLTTAKSHCYTMLWCIVHHNTCFMLCFSDVSISQDSVAMHLRCGDWWDIRTIIKTTLLSATQAMSVGGEAGWPVILTGWPAGRWRWAWWTHATVWASQEQTLSGTGERVYTAHRGWLGVVTGISAASTGGVLLTFTRTLGLLLSLLVNCENCGKLKTKI